MERVRRVQLVKQDGFIASVVVDRATGVEVKSGPLHAMRRLAADLATEHQLVEARVDVWERRAS